MDAFVPPRRALRFALAVLGLAVTALALWWLFPPDPERELRRRWSPLARVERAAAPELGAGVERWRLIAAAGDTALGLWRPAGVRAAHAWTVVMLGGLGTGDRAALLLPPGLPVNALAVDWPWTGPRKLPALGILVRLGPIRDALLRTPAVLAQGVEAVARQPGVDSMRIVLLGASLGVPPAAAALRLTSRPRALVLMDGAADLARVLRAGLRREGCPRPLVRPVAALVYRLLRPLEPALNAEAAAGRRVLLINATRDELLPRAAIERLHAAYPSADTRWRAAAHIRPRRGAEIAEVAREIEAWLESAGPAAPPPPAGTGR